ncbi:hypothetical protein FNV43_RR03792 [Rhamnella rubrinervis]|uniref:Protein kinase domain-containing protein n=1 Tax=Rhamnella rubrinervis TaxID=2594499 RepID=A0A8K0MP70_9ROSA|nr:hypothetical protein FNV43_RR03792 [Rhamnella rubrinervis]
MQSSRGFDLFLKGQIFIAVALLLSINVCMGSEYSSSESEAFLKFITAVDPQDKLKVSHENIASKPHPCLHRWKGLKCNSQATTILEIWLENLDLGGILDSDSLCKLPNLRVISLARNQIRGTIPNSILYCRKLTYLNLSSNHLSGSIPMALTKLKHLRRLDISNNYFTNSFPYYKDGFKQLSFHSGESSSFVNLMDGLPPSDNPVATQKPQQERWTKWIPWIIGIGFFFLFIYFVDKRGCEARGREPELVFFVEENERFKVEELLDATADLRSQSLCSNLFKVSLKNNGPYAVKSLKKVQVSLEEFGETMKQIGNLKHPNILPLAGYASTNEEKLLIYKYQSSGNLLNLLDNHIKGEKEFPWRLRLSIAGGIARGLGFIYQKFGDQEGIPHGNLKLSNILLDENDAPLISEYGISRFEDPKRAAGLYPSKGYTAPERSMTEKGDVFSFGVILLELLTGKTVEKSEIDLPKWVKAIIREEWTGEVFDKGVAKAAKQWAFPVLNIALKCVSHSPEDRPTMTEVLEKIEEIVNAQEHHSNSSESCNGSRDEDCCPLHSIISETWDTPGSNY